MKFLISTTIWQIFLLLFLIAKNKDDGGKELFKSQPWRSTDVILAIFLINVFSYLTYLLSTVRSIQPFLKTSDLFLFHSFLFLLIVALVRFKAKQNFGILGFKSKDPLQKIIGLGIAAAFIIYLIDNVLYFAFAKHGNYAASIIKDLKGLEKPLDYIKYGVVVVILGPIMEECLYRGILYSPYRKKYGPMRAIFINALLFSIGHYGTNIVHNFIAGIFLGALYEKKESIIPSIVAHSANNLLGVLTAFYFLTMTKL